MSTRFGRSWSIVLALGLLAAILVSCSSASGDADSTEPETITVGRGSLTSTVTAIGSVVPRAQVSHAFGVTGRVAEVLVQVGDRVQAGETLARLDTGELALQVQSAEAVRSAAQAQLDQLRAGARPEEIAVARANLDAAEARLAAAEDDLSELQEDDRATDTQMRAAETNVTILEAQRDAARAQRDLLLNGSTLAELAAAEAQLAQADAALAAAHLALGQAELTSAIAGLVARVDVSRGQLVIPQTPVIAVIDDSYYQVEVDVDETDISAVEMGQEVGLTLDAFLGQRLTGRVTAIAPTATLDLGVVSYRVTIKIEGDEFPLRAGLTTSAEIIQARRDDALLIPNLAIAVDESSGQIYVNRKTAGGEERVAIEIGMSSDIFSEVLSGLQEGDQIVVNTVSYRNQLQEVMESYIQGGDQD